MNIPKWILPVVAVVAALAVGVAAALIGMRFAPAAPASAFVPPETETAQVLAPVPADDGDDGNDADGDGDPADLPSDSDDAGGDVPSESPVVGELEVAVAEEDPAVSDTELLRLIDLIGLSPDLLVGLMDLGLGERDDDPCAPPDGDPADDCPPGSAGIVLYDGALPPLWMNAQAFPRTHDDLGDLPDRDLGELFCDIAQENADEATLRIRATAPGTWTVRYWPVDRPDEIEELAPVTSSDAQIADWQTEASDVDHGLYIAEHCLRLPGLELDTAYTAVISGSDVFGRTPAASTVHFNSDGAPRHPDLELQPVGQNLLLASVAHAPDENISIRAYLVPAADAPTCSTAEGAIPQLGPLTTVDHVAVGSAEQLRLNITSDNTEKAVHSYRVPEGATLLMCARWYPGGDAPTWESENATYEASAIVQSADRFLPSLEFSGFTPRDERTVDLRVTVSTPEGTVCSRFVLNSADLGLPRILCHPDSVATGGVESTGTPGSERLADRGFSGDLVVRVDATLSSGETSETTYVLPAGSGSCVGVCSAPGPSEFGVATIGGTMHLTETWVAGLQNGGVSEWRVWGETANPIDYVAPDAPQIDRDTDWTFTEPSFSPVLQAITEIRADRPVDWEFTTYSSTGDPAMTCGPTPAPIADSGRAEDGVIGIVVPVCLGGSYLSILRLVDDEGHVALYSAPGAGPSAAWWPAGYLLAPRLDVTIRYRVDAFDHSQVYVQHLGLLVDGSELRLTDDYASPAGSRCNTDGIIKSEGTFDDNLGAEFTLGLAVLIVDQRPASDGSCGGEFVDERAVPSLTTFQIEQLRNPDGVLIETSTTRLHIWAERR